MRWVESKRLLTRRRQATLNRHLFSGAAALEATILCRRALDAYVDARGHPLSLSGLLHVPLGMLHYEANELEVLRLVAEGLSNGAVGAEFFISVGIVKW